MNTSEKVYFRPAIGQNFEFETKEFKEIKQSLDMRPLGDSVTMMSKSKFLYSCRDFEQDSITRSAVKFLAFEQQNRDAHSNNEVKLSENPMQNGLQAFSGATFSVQVGKFGEILNIEGYDMFKTKFDKFYKDANAEKDVNTNVFFSRQYFKDFFERLTTILPKSGAAVGDQWQIEQSVLTCDHIRSTVSYKLVSINDGIALIHANYKIDYPLPMMSGTEMQLKGMGEGEIRLSASTGMLISSSNSMLAEGNINLGARTMTMDCKFSTDITSRMIE
ncbi:MAG TPA: DUF6263 family protein [Puia sp.]|jgi:hypothetical protein|nr:DUF6263 family protein [Puia sp.]